MKHYGIIILFLLLLSACQKRHQEPVVNPWGEETVDENFDLDDIEQAGEMIALTISGPETYYDYRGIHLGVHTMLCQQFADSLGVRMRIELCRDTVELLSRLKNGDADIVVYPISPVSSSSPGWKVAEGKTQLKKKLESWYDSERMMVVRREEQRLLKSGGGVRRKVFAPMLNSKGGVISRYDGLFKRHCQPIKWDWRLMAAQCYQESTFDPNALSWAGARGLMQIMPSTADHLGLSREQLNQPEPNIAAAVRYLNELEQSFSDVKNRRERQDFVLAAYNGGAHHVRDAMALAKEEGHNPFRWSEVSVYVLKLSEPRYYQHPIVKYGYMRGNETVDYVQSIRQRYQHYCGVRSVSAGNSTPQKSQNAKHRSKYSL